MKRLADFQRLVDNHWVIYLDNSVNEDMVQSMRKQIAGLDPGAEEVAVVLKTGGGSTGSGFAIIHELRTLASKRKLWLVAESYVNSFGIYILTAFPLEQRVAFSLTTFYGHWGKMDRKIRIHGTPKQVRYQIKEILADVELFEREQKLLINMMTAGSQLSRKRVKKLFSEPRCLSAKKAKKLGLISEILS